jgi:hypothetical protein
MGLDYHAANFITAIVMFLIWTVGPSLMWKFWLQKRRIWSGLAGVAFYGVIWLMVSTVGSNVCFDRQTGKPLCYFVDTATGRKWSRTPGFDPSSGKQFQLYTREIKEREDRSKALVTPSSTEANRSRAETVTPSFVPTVKIQTAPEISSVRNQPSEQKHATTIDNSPKKQDRKAFQSAPKEIESPIVEVQKTETYSTIRPQQEVKPSPSFKNELIIVQPQSFPTRPTERETSNTENRRENTTPNPKGQEKKKEEDPVKKALKNSTIDLLNFGLEKLKRKIQ